MKICFVSGNVYPYLSGTYVEEKIGGAELQQVVIGRGLQRIGYDVVFITQDYGQREGASVGGFKVHKTFRANTGIPVLRFLHPRLTKIWQALIRSDADVYYTRGAGFLPGILAIFCSIYKKRFIFAGASETDFIPDKFLIPTLRDKILYQYGIRRASVVIVQSEFQKKLLWNNFGIRGQVIHNFLDKPGAVITNDSNRDYILWVSTICEIKQPIHFVQLAKAFPSEQFVMIGGRDSLQQRLFKEVEDRAAKVHNLQFLGFQPFEETEKYFDRAKVFVNTSVHEGFPNTFLQAWRRGIPVVSYVNPDNLITENRLGYAVSSEKELHRKLFSFLEDSETFKPSSIISYYDDNHSSKVIDEYCSLLETI
jgi:hypothetical protein